MKFEADQIRFDPASTADPAGRVFYWQDEVFRGIKASAAPFYRSLFDQGILPSLFRSGLIETEVVSSTLPGYELILKHYTIPFRSYCFEWCSEMLKQAALKVCDLAVELERIDLQLNDMHPWNILFDGWQPKFIDFTSIVPIDSRRLHGRYNEFCYSFLYPLKAMAAGRGRLARCLLQRGLTDKAYREEIVTLLPTLQSTVLRGSNLINRGPMSRLRNIFQRNATKEQVLALLSHVRCQVEDIKVRPHGTEWSGYSDDPDYWLDFEPNDRWSHKHRNVFTILKRLQPGSLLDIGCSRGWYSQLAARQGIQVVAFDIDEPSLNALYHDARSSNLSILPLLIDFVRSRPQTISYDIPAERIRTEMVLALGLVHHCVFKEWLRFDVIVKELSAYTQQWLLVEFVPPDDRHVSKWYSDQFSWYKLDNFMAALEKHFTNIEIMESAPVPRKLLLCEKR